MCRQAGSIVIALGAALLGTAPLVAQDSAAILHGMESRLDSLRRVIAVADSLSLTGGPADTFTVGTLRIASSPELRPEVQAAATEAWERLQLQFGASLERASLPVFPFGSRFDSSAGRVDPNELARAIQRTVARTIWDQQDSALAQWLGAYVPLDPADSMDVRAIRDGMVRTPAIPNATCLDGSVAACTLGLGLGGQAGTLTAWYAPATWQHLAELTNAVVAPQERPAQTRCVDAGDLSACEDVLSRTVLPPPVPPTGRQLLTKMALESGGVGAFERMTAEPAATIEERLAAASGVPFDSLVTTWMRAVRSAPSETPAPGGLEILVVLAWSTLVLFMSLRGSRCR